VADNYLQTSESLDNVTDAEIEWLTRQTDAEALESAADAGSVVEGEEPLVLLEHCKECGGCVSVDWEVHDGCQMPDGTRQEYVWFHDEAGSMDVDALACLMQAFLKKFRPTEVFALTWASTCSKPRLGEFGGGGFAVSADNIEWFSAHTLVQEAATRMKHAITERSEVQPDHEASPDAPAEEPPGSGS